MSSPRRPEPADYREGRTATDTRQTGGARPDAEAEPPAPPDEAAGDRVTGDGATGDGAAEQGAQPPGPDGAGHLEATTDEPHRTVQILDLPTQRVRRPADLLHLIASAVGIAVILILSVYAYSTTTGVTRDVQSALAQVVRSVVLVPVTVIEGLLILVLPVVVIGSQVIWRNLRVARVAVISSSLAYLMATVVVIWMKS